jgi:TRAP-type mannitol/chloroaromatic compound transport system permease large subunit
VAPRQVLLTQIFGGCLPFLFIVIVCMVIVYLVPAVVTWLPGVLYG